MFRRRPNPARAAPLQRLLVEELEPRVLFSADAEAVLPGVSWQPDQAAGQQVESAMMSAHQVRNTSDADATGAQAAEPRHEVAFVDGGVDNADQLVALLQQQADADGRVLEVVRLDANADGLQQISDWLAQRKDLDAVHVFSHGQAGSLQLGSSVLDAATLAERAGELVQWSQAFGDDGDLLLYGCDLAANADGRQLLSDLSLLTGTDVAASEDRTGASALGGDWVLEQSVGQVETAVALGSSLQAQWQGVLATATFQQGVSSYTGTQDTVINSAAPNTADGANALLNMPTADNDAKQVLLRFDNLFSSAGGSIPDGSVITSATLRLYITEDGTGDAYLHRILSANWDESSTWNSLTNGISIDDVEASSTSAGANDLSTKNVYTTFTVTSTVQAWANGASNLGWMLYTDGNEVAFASSENGTSANRPLLTVNYTAPTPPAVDLNGGVAGTGYSAAYVENTPVNITSSALATVTAGSNGISPNLSGMTVTISNIQNAGLESLLADVTGTNISKSYNASTGVLTLSGSDTAANYQQVLRTIQYDNASDHPSTTTRTINFVAMDPYGGNGATATASVTVTRVNDAPVITSNGGGATANVNVNETVTAVTTVVATDAEGSAITYSLGGTDASLFNLNSSTGVLTFKNAPDFESPQDSGGDNVYNVTVYASDSLLLDQQDIAITVLDMPTTLVVDTTADTNDTGLGTSFNVEQLNASKGTDGKVSLREAIIAANNTAGLNTVTFNITGSTGAYGEYTITLSSTLPTISEAIYLNAATQAGYTSQPLIVLDGNGGAGHGFTLNSTADGSTIRGFVIRDFSADGIHIDSGSDNHTIVGNYIGSFNADGSNAGSGERNLSEGIESYGANVVIGGTTAADRNVISGNASAYNIYLATGANGTTVQGNYIGTDAAGTSAFTSTNSAYGIMLETSASNVTIGGAATGAGNVISGFSNRGIWVTTTGTVTVQGNKIGTDVTGTIDLGNGGYGLYVDDGGTVAIGGTAAGAGNLVSGNDGGGVYVGGSVSATVQGNIIGLNASGTAALGNTGVGVYLISSNATTVGGSTAAARNIVSGNSSHGIEVQSSPVAGHRILGNHIGVGADGVTLLGNGGAGVYISAHYVVVGGKDAGEGNVIAGNGGDGIAVVGGHSNFYYRNSIHSNAGLGVDLDNDGVTLNDTNDGDGGANYRNNFPVITSVVTGGSSTRIHGAIDWYTGGATIYIEFFANDVVDASGHGEGKTYLGFVQVTTDASGNASFSLDVSGVSVGQWVTAIANTETTFPGASEFALAVQAVAPANGPRGKLIWNNNDQFYQYYADWFGGSTGFGGTGVNGLSYGDDISMLAAAESPVREEIIFIGSADVSGRVLAGVWDGQNWSTVLSIPIADPSDFSSQYNNFALAYDEVSGDAMLVWSNGTTGTAGLSYATWNGSSWSSIQSITAPVSGEPVHMQIAAHPSSHEMILVAHTNAASNNEYALVWNGSSWGNGQVLGTNTNRQFFELNVAYEKQSGQAMVVYDASASDSSAIQYRTWSGSSWSAEQSLSAPAGVTATSELHTVVLVSDPSSDRLALAGKNAANQVWLQVWDGSSWDGGLLATSAGVTLVDHHATMALAFESQSGDLLAAYGTNTGPSVFYRTWTSGGGWSAQGTGPSMGGTDVPYVVKLYADPYSDTIMLGVQDNAADLNMVAWDGSGWGSVNTLDAATGFNYRENFTFVWYRDSAVISYVDGDSLSYQEDAGAVVLDQGTAATLTMGNDADYDGAVLTVSFTAGSTVGEDVLGVRNQGSGAGQVGVSGANITYGGVVVGTFSGGSGGTPLSITFNVAASDSAATAVLRNITYANTNTSTPDTTNRVVRLVVQSPLGHASAYNEVTVQVQAVNDAPVNAVPGAQSVNEDASLTFSSGNGNRINVGDVDAASGNIEVQLSVNQGVLNVPGWAATTASSLTLTGTVAQVQAWLASVVYTPTAQYAGVDTLTVTTSDLGNSGTGGTATDVDTVTINVNAVNDAPVITSDGGGATAALSVNEGATSVTTVTASDADADTLVYSIVGGADAGRFTINASTGVLSFASAPDHEAPLDANGDNLYEVSVRVSDGTVQDTQDITVTVNNLNDNAPVITSNGGGASDAVSQLEGTTAVTTVTATDADGDTLSYHIVGGADAAQFQINSATGALSFVGAPDFESPADAGGNNVYDVVVEVRDGVNTDTQSLAITITDGNDQAPVITSDGGGASANLNIDENTTAVTTGTATDGDSVGTLSWRIAGGADAARFVIDSGTGALSFVSAPDFEAPTDAGGNNVYDVVIEVSDGSNVDTQAIAVTVDDVFEVGNPPVITSDGGGASASLSLNENTTAVTTVTATDADGNPLSYHIAGGADAARFVIDSGTGALSFVSAPDFDAPLDAGGNNVYDVVVEVTDGISVDAQAISVTVNDLNDTTPAVTSNGGGATASVNVAEGGTSVTTVTATDADTVGSITYRIAGGADAARFTINAATGALSFAATPDFENPQDTGADNAYEVIVEADDGVQATQQALTVNVTDTNDTAPDVTSNGGGATAAINVVEGSTAVTTVTATDADTVGSITYRIAGGADAARFTINAATGALSFAATPDFENPQDTGADNAYEVIVEADDGVQATQQTLTVNVTDTNDTAPDVTSNGGDATATINVSEGTAAVTTVTAVDPDTVGSLTYRIAGGADAARFTINAATGALSFAATPDFENPQDTGADNAYEVIVEADDGVQATQQTLTVNVTDLNDTAPDVTSDGGGATAAINVSEGTTAVTTVTAVDPDTVGSLIYRIAGGADAGSFTINAATGALSFAATPDFENPQDTGADNAYEVIVEADDGVQATQQTLTVNVTDANDTAPDVTSNGGAATATINVSEGTTAVTTVTAIDADTVGSLTYRIAGGADAARFTINAATGELSFAATPDFESPQDTGADNAYEVIVEADDGVQATQQTLTVNVTDSNDNAPVITSDGGGAIALIQVDEGGTAVTTATATDADVTASLSWGIVGGADAARFTINASTGVLSFVQATDHEAPLDVGADNVYAVRIQVSDGAQTSWQDLLVTVRDLNDNTPVITSHAGAASATVNHAENTLAFATLTATDADATSTLVWRISGGADAARFTIDASTGALSFVTAPDHEAPADADTDGTYEVTVEVDDGSQTDSQALSIVVDNVNEGPAWSGAAPSYTTPAGAPLTVVAGGGLMGNAQDPDGDPMQTILVSGPSRGSVSLSPDGGFVYQPQAGFAGVDFFTVALSDGGLQSASRVIEVRVEAPPSAPDAVVRNPDPPPAPAPTPPSAPAPTPAPESAPAPAPAPADPAPIQPAAPQPVVDGLGLVGPADPNAWLARTAPAAGTDGAPAPSTSASADAAAAGLSLRIDAGASLTLVPVDSPLVAFSRLLQASPAQTETPTASLDIAVPAIDLGGFMGWPPNAGEDGANVDVKVAQAGGAALSAGAVWWAARTSGLLASMAISAPVWRGIDPLPVLGGAKSRDDELPQGGSADADAEGDIDHVFDRNAAAPVGSDIALGSHAGGAR